jgi:bla regulator protein blaR1
MLRSLLADRFRLSVHNETRELPVYALTMARTDGRLGSQLKQSTVDCQAARGAGRGGPPTGAGTPPCSMRVAPGALFLSGFPLSQLATALSNFVRRTVVDSTGLAGTFDVELHWTPEQMPQGTAPSGAPPLPPPDPNGPSIFTAVQEQLGLKLEASKVPQEVLVIDHVELPTPD